MHKADFHARRLLILTVLLAGLIGLAGCETHVLAPEPTPQVSLWGEVFTIGQAEQLDAPAVLLTGDGVTAAWFNADDSGIHHEIRQLDANGITEQGTLSLWVTRPYDLTVLPAANGSLHLLWLDAERESDDDSSRLFTANVNGDLEPERGPISASIDQTLRYVAISNGDGSAWAVWSGGLLAEPSLYAQFIDGLSRPRIPDHLVDNADWPALLRSGTGELYLFWLSGTRVFRASLNDGTLEESQSIGDSILLARGDRLTGFYAGLDSTQAYLFWNVTRADASAETWYTHGEINSTNWNSPSRLSIGWSGKGVFETGYNSGSVYPAWPDDHPVSRAIPAGGQSDILAVAAQVDGSLGIIYLQNGAAVGYQAIVTPDSPLTGEPALYVDRDRHLYLVWSELTPDGYSDLKLTTTRRD